MRTSFPSNSILLQRVALTVLGAALMASCGDEPPAPGDNSTGAANQGGRLDLARALRASREFEASSRHYRELLRRSGASDLELVLEAVEVFLELQQFETAIDALQSISDDDDDDDGDDDDRGEARILRARARALHGTGRQADAESALRLAAKIDPEYVARSGLFGRILLAQGKHLEAIRELERVLNRRKILRLEEGRAPLYYHLGRAYRAVGKDPLAKEAFSRHRRLLEESERIGRLERAVQNRPESPDALLDLALAQYGADRRAQATQSLREALRLSKDRADIEAIMAVVLVQGDRIDEGIGLARLSLSKVENPMAHYALVLADHLRGDSDSAKQQILLTVSSLDKIPECFHEEIRNLARRLKEGE